jgi:hypothetical protein
MRVQGGRFRLINTARLICHKTLGCYREFGLGEIFRRFIRESFRPIGRSKDPDVSLVAEEFAVGAAPKSKAALDCLKGMGFEHVIDLRAERSRNDILAGTEEVSVHWIPTHDDWRAKSFDFYRQLEATIRLLLAGGEKAKFYICCAAGEHRAPLGGVLALVVLGHSVDIACTMIRDARPVAEILPPYRSSLVDYLVDRQGDISLDVEG